jgi:hypothetical protein
MNLMNDPTAALGLVFALVCLWWLYRVSRSDANTYELSDLITTKGRMDLSKVGQLTCLLTTTWVVVHMELKAGVQEWALGLYMLAWVGAGFGSLYARVKGGAPPNEPREPQEQPRQPGVY